VLKRILASIAITSLLLVIILLVYWWRGNHGYTDTFTLGKGTQTETQFSTIGNGRIEVHVIDRHSVDVTDRIEFRRFKDVLGYFLIVPGLWVAIKVRSLLPRPPGRVGMEDRR
jgi:hypothetical protein